MAIPPGRGGAFDKLQALEFSSERWKETQSRTFDPQTPLSQPFRNRERLAVQRLREVRTFCAKFSAEIASVGIQLTGIHCVAERANLEGLRQRREWDGSEIELEYEAGI